MSQRTASFLLIAALIFPALAGAQTPTPAAQPTPGPTAAPTVDVATDTRTVEYRMPPELDGSVLSSAITEVWGSLTYPQNPAPGKKLPLIVLLHGNHGTCGTGVNPRNDASCEYTERGTCPAGYVVTPNHRGYDYAATKLAHDGFVVVSVNANRGITCGDGGPDDSGLNLARGRLLLKHLSLLTQWSLDPSKLLIEDVPVRTQIDFQNIGMMGHSRGGEGVRAAYAQLNDPGSAWPARMSVPIRIEALFEIGPVDGQTSRVLDANDVAWNVLLPMCDGDVWDLEGIQPFDRMLKARSEVRPHPKSVFNVWGANHNFFNTEWQSSDSSGCDNHKALFSTTGSSSPEQTQIADVAMRAFFDKALGKAPASDPSQGFDPSFALFPEVAALTRVDRTWENSCRDSDSFTVEDFRNGGGQGRWGQPIAVSNATLTRQFHSPHVAAQTGEITWNAPSASIQFNIESAPGSSVDLTGFSTFDVRVTRAGGSKLNVDPFTTWSAQLVSSSGQLSDSVEIGADHSITDPVDHDLLFQIRVDLSKFHMALDHVAAIRFNFDRTPSGDVAVADLQFSKFLHGIPAVTPFIQSAPSARISLRPVVALQSKNDRGLKLPEQIRLAPFYAETKKQNLGRFKTLEFGAATDFTVRDALYLLELNGQVYDLSRYPANGSIDRLLFDVPIRDLEKIGDRRVGVRVGVQGTPRDKWTNLGLVALPR